MKSYKFPPTKMFLQTIALLVLVFGFLDFNAYGQTVPNDLDQDGFDDDVESQGITLWNETSVVLPCDPSEPLPTRCVLPGRPDVFLYISGAPGGSLASLVDPLLIISNLQRDPDDSTSRTGAHQLSGNEMSFEADTFRQISQTQTIQQKAIYIQENLGTQSANTNTDGVWGSSPRQGTPMTPGGGFATVYTQQISDDITEVYARKRLPVPVGLIEDCTRHVTAHEAGHNMALAAQPDPSLTGSHYSTEEQVVLSQSPTIITKGKEPSVVCPDVYAFPDGPGFRLN